MGSSDQALGFVALDHWVVNTSCESLRIPWGNIFVAHLAASHIFFVFIFSQVNLFRQGELAGADFARMMPETP
jgi:hypothetical protein